MKAKLRNKISKKKCGTIKSLWYHYNMSEITVDLLLFILSVLLLPFAYIYVKVNNLLYKITR